MQTFLIYTSNVFDGHLRHFVRRLFIVVANDENEAVSIVGEYLELSFTNNGEFYESGSGLTGLVFEDDLDYPMYDYSEALLLK